jgi:hypothetical protein
VTLIGSRARHFDAEPIEAVEDETAAIEPATRIITAVPVRRADLRGRYANEICAGILFRSLIADR